MKKKAWVSLVAVVLVLCCAVGGTLAWLTAKTNDVVNTFTPSNISIGLEETTGKDYKMIPGWTIDKNPKAWVEDGSEECYLFVKLVWANNTFETNKSYVSYTPAVGWTALDDEDGVYYREVNKAGMSTDDGATNSFPILLNDKVTVSGDITSAMMTAFENGTATKPTLTITAYASQLYKNNTEKFTPAEAWGNAPKD